MKIEDFVCIQRRRRQYSLNRCFQTINRIVVIESVFFTKADQFTLKKATQFWVVSFNDTSVISHTSFTRVFVLVLLAYMGPKGIGKNQ